MSEGPSAGAPIVVPSQALVTISAICGWIYTIAWACSFYPQAILNWKRKSVVGLSYDYMSFLLVGVTIYAVYNNAFYFNSQLQSDWIAAYGPPIPVMLNDVIFANHGILISYIIFAQFFFYRRDPRERLSIFARVVNVAIGATLLIQIILCLAHVETWLTLTQAMGVIRVGIVIVQVLPQILKHYREKRTDGWSIWGIFLDIIGSLFSFLQQFIDAIAVQNWAVAFGSPAKILLALVILLLDLVFIVQHYVLYRNPPPLSVGYDKLSEEEESALDRENQDS